MHKLVKQWFGIFGFNIVLYGLNLSTKLESSISILSQKVSHIQTTATELFSQKMGFKCALFWFSPTLCFPNTYYAVNVDFPR